MNIVREETAFDNQKHTVDTGTASELGCEDLYAEILLERELQSFGVSNQKLRINLRQAFL